MKKFLCAFAGLLLVGCATPEVVLYNGGFTPRASNAHLDIYRTNTPDKPYVEIAEISCTDEWWDSRNTEMENIRMKALEMGADGIIILGGTGYHAATSGGKHYSLSKLSEEGTKVIAIKYK